MPVATSGGADMETRVGSATRQAAAQITVAVAVLNGAFGFQGAPGIPSAGPESSGPVPERHGPICSNHDHLLHNVFSPLFFSDTDAQLRLHPLRVVSQTPCAVFAVSAVSEISGTRLGGLRARQRPRQASAGSAFMVAGACRLRLRGCWCVPGSAGS